MIEKYFFNEEIQRVFNFITNSQIISQCLFKDYISDVKFLNDPKKRDRSGENNSNIITNNRSSGRNNDSSQNLVNMNNVGSKTTNSTNPIMGVNNSFLYLNASFKSIHLDKMEGLIIECKWKKKYILLLRVIKINNTEKFYKSIEIECIEMNHFENAFNLEIALYWNTTTLQTVLLLKIITKYKIIEEIIKREFNDNDKKIISDRLLNYLTNDLTNLENCATTLIFANAKDIAVYLSDITKIIKFSPEMQNKRFEVYSSPLINNVRNCKVYDLKTNKLWQDYIFSGFYADKMRGFQIRWEKKENNKTFCMYRISITFLEDNISLLIYKNMYTTHVTTQYLSDINCRKKLLFNEIREYFNKRNSNTKLINCLSCENNNLGLNLQVGIKNYKYKDNQNELNMFIHNNNSFLKNLNLKEEEKENDSQLNSLMQSYSNLENNILNDDKEGGNLFSDSLQNISEIQNINSAFLNPNEEDNNNNVDC